MKYSYFILAFILYGMARSKLATSIHLRVVSYNVGDQTPADNQTVIDALFESSNPSSGNKPEIQVVGLQEAPAAYFNNEWTHSLCKALRPKGYILSKHESIGAILLCIFLRDDQIFTIRDFEVERVKTGFGGYLANKGGISVRFTVNGNSICITNAHLAAHLEKQQERIEDYNSIMDGTRFQIDKNTYSILTHDYSIWFGDLNFRLDGIERDEVMKNIDKISKTKSISEKKAAISSLFKYDQLTGAKNKGLIFDGFIDSPVSFPPTYKFRKNSVDEYDNERIPAWTDRVLYRYHENVYNTSDDLREFKPKIELISFDSLPKVTLSDHKPVAALFDILTFDPQKFNPSVVPYEAVIFEPIRYWNSTKDNRFWYSINDSVFRIRPRVLSSYDRIALYKADFRSFDEQVTFIYPNNEAHVEPIEGSYQVPYLSSSPLPSRHSSNAESSQSSDNLARGPSASKPNHNIDSPRKYFTGLIADETILPPGHYVLVYLAKAMYENYNVLGKSQIFEVR